MSERIDIIAIWVNIMNGWPGAWITAWVGAWVGAWMDA